MVAVARFRRFYVVELRVEDGNGAVEEHELEAPDYEAAERVAEALAEAYRRRGAKVAYHVAKAGELVEV